VRKSTKVNGLDLSYLQWARTMPHQCCYSRAPERLTGALLDRLTHHGSIDGRPLEGNSMACRFGSLLLRCERERS
jgi:hypothetical protein